MPYFMAMGEMRGGGEVCQTYDILMASEAKLAAVELVRLERDAQGKIYDEGFMMTIELKVNESCISKIGDSMQRFDLTEELLPELEPVDWEEYVRSRQL